VKNTERRTALDTARKLALLWAGRAEENYTLTSYEGNKHNIEMANMWSRLANAMKVGDERADNV
jgi:hypothetical protein